MLLLLVAHAYAAEPEIDCVEVKTRAKENALVKVWYRVPRNHDANGKGLSRILILFGGRNSDGKPEVSGKLGWTEWADLNGIFLVSPTLKNDDYWEPEKWSGRAMQDALAQIAAKYRIATSGLLYYGYSAGSQASNLFPAWRPDLCRAYVSHACGVFHTPTSLMKDVAGLVTCGDADTARYVISRRFVEKCRSLGISIVWKSFPNHPHDVPPGSVRLAQEFLAHHHWTHPEDLGRERVHSSPPPTFVGDDADGVYFPSGSADAEGVMDEDRVALPSESVALAWGMPGRAGSKRKSKVKIAADVIKGVEVVSVVSGDVRSDARILVLVGGRGWPGTKSIRDLGFAKWAVGRGWCIVAPSFAEGEYWEPKSGSGVVIRAAVDALCKRHGIRPLPVFLFGYSAGGQLVALLQEADPSLPAAWAVYGCGVYPDSSAVKAPGFVSCGMEDADRLRISRDFIYRAREAGGQILWKPTRSGHELNEDALELARFFFSAAADGSPCALWGEDDTHQIRPETDIDIEFRNPLFNPDLAARWKRETSGPRFDK
ncbi:MAG TPA: hypothetical protein DER26_06515 [Verrucomicrobia bacterium]|nr:hypothetical protein [Verrucomicrobiota bacterium]